MNRADEVTGMLSSYEAVDAATHLLGRLIGEGQAQDVSGIDTKYVDQIGIPVGKHTRLAGACPGNYSYSSFGCLHGFQLSVVESSQFHIYVL